MFRLAFKVMEIHVKRKTETKKTNKENPLTHGSKDGLVILTNFSFGCFDNYQQRKTQKLCNYYDFETHLEMILSFSFSLLD